MSKVKRRAALKCRLFVYLAFWGQALPSGKDTFLPLALKAFPRIRPDPDIHPFYSIEINQ
ncbi:hypothetical protein LCGC14_1643490 [marine sediment metagenome]|uniref:Uncharacterized protein n=1 Tax=marine sediment metagenome TaxID=412755 RepID=A0A0F9ILH3_9ZZZZ